MPEEVRAYLLCRLFGWSEREYLDATVKFSEYALAFRKQESDQDDDW